VCEIERDKGKKTKKYIGRVGEGESATRFNLLFICVSMGFPLFFWVEKCMEKRGRT